MLIFISSSNFFKLLPISVHEIYFKAISSPFIMFEELNFFDFISRSLLSFDFFDYFHSQPFLLLMVFFYFC